MLIGYFTMLTDGVLNEEIFAWQCLSIILL